MSLRKRYRPNGGAPTQYQNVGPRHFRRIADAVLKRCHSTSGNALRFCRDLILCTHFARRYISLKGYGISLRGMRVALSLLRRPRVLDVHGVKIYFDPRISSSYVRHIAGEWNEPETHLFVSRVLSVSQMPVQAVNVGAKVGEMALDFARQPSVEKVGAYEPQAVACEAIRRSVILNGLENVSLMHAACGTDSRVAYLQIQKNSQASRIVENPNHSESLPVQVLTLNDLD